MNVLVNQYLVLSVSIQFHMRKQLCYCFSNEMRIINISFSAANNLMCFLLTPNNINEVKLLKTYFIYACNLYS